MTQPTRPIRKFKTDTQSLARHLSEESSLDLRQIKETRNAAYKAGFAMAAGLLRTYLRKVERGTEPIDIGKMIIWSDEVALWRRNNSLDSMPELV